MKRPWRWEVAASGRHKHARPNAFMNIGHLQGSAACSMMTPHTAVPTKTAATPLETCPLSPIVSQRDNTDNQPTFRDATQTQAHLIQNEVLRCDCPSRFAVDVHLPISIPRVGGRGDHDIIIQGDH